MNFNYDYERKSKHKIEKVEEILKPECMCKMNGVNAVDFKLINGEQIKTSSKKLQAFFLKNYTCEECGAKGTHFAIEKNKGKNKYFLNLYTIIDGQEVLMVKELKTPAKLGGLDIPNNWLVVCDKCYLNKIRDVKKEMLNSGDYETGYILKLNNRYLNIKVSKDHVYSVKYVDKIQDAKTYKNKGLLRKKVQKMINANLLPEKDINNYEIKLKNLEEV